MRILRTGIIPLLFFSFFITNTHASTTVDGTIYRLGGINSNESTVDYHFFKVNSTGIVSVDIRSAEVNPDGWVDTDLNGDGEIAFIDSYIYLFKNDGSLDETDLVASNDDSDDTFADGSTYKNDSYWSGVLESGYYVLAVGAYDLYIEDAIAGINTNSDSPFGSGFYPAEHGDYRVTFSGDVTLDTTKDTPANYLKSTITALQVVSGIHAGGAPEPAEADLDNDGQVGLADALLGLQLGKELTEETPVIRTYSKGPFKAGSEIRFMVSNIDLLDGQQAYIHFNDFQIPVIDLDEGNSTVTTILPFIAGLSEVYLTAGPYQSNSFTLSINSSPPELSAAEISGIVNSALSDTTESLQALASTEATAWNFEPAEIEALATHGAEVNSLATLYQTMAEQLSPEDRLFLNTLLVNSGAINQFGTAAAPAGGTTVVRSPSGATPLAVDQTCQAIIEARALKSGSGLMNFILQESMIVAAASGNAPALATLAVLSSANNLAGLAADFMPTRLTGFEISPSAGSVYRDQAIDLEFVGSFESESTIPQVIIKTIIDTVFNKVLEKAKPPEGVEEDNMIAAGKQFVGSIAGELGLDDVKDRAAALTGALGPKTMAEVTCPITAFTPLVLLSPDEKAQYLLGQIKPAPYPMELGNVAAHFAIVEEQDEEGNALLLDSKFNFEILNHPPELTLPEEVTAPDDGDTAITCSLLDVDKGFDGTLLDTEFLAATIGTMPAYGSLSGSCGEGYTYRYDNGLPPAAEDLTVSVTILGSAVADLAGHATQPSDSFTVVATDSFEEVAKTVNISIVGGNDSSLTYVILDQPSFGRLTHMGGRQYVYEQTTATELPDSFTYAAFDGINYSAPATVTVEVDLFADPGLEACVKDRLDATGDTLDELSSLDCSWRGLTSLQGIEYLTGLSFLTLYGGNQITDISPLENLTALFSLDIRNNPVSDLTPLQNLTHLSTLRIGGTLASDLTPLQNLTALTQLSLGGNPQINNLAPLQNLTALKSLSVVSTSVSDITPLQGLAALEDLSLSSNQISDIAPLQNLTALTYLSLGENQISNITPLQNLTSLTKLYLNDNQIVGSLSPLRNLSVLTRLYLSNNQISSIGSSLNLSALTVLDLTHNQITDISGIQGLTALDRLWLYDNQVNDISPLQSLTALTNLSLTGNQVNNISPLQHLTALTILDLGSNQVNDISPLQHLTALTSLGLSDNQIGDIIALQYLTGLESLGLSNNTVHDISFLQSLTSLNELYLSYNWVSDISGIESFLGGIDYLSIDNNCITLPPGWPYSQQSVSQVCGIDGIMYDTYCDLWFEDVEPQHISNCQ